MAPPPRHTSVDTWLKDEGDALNVDLNGGKLQAAQVKPLLDAGAIARTSRLTLSNLDIEKSQLLKIVEALRFETLEHLFLNPRKLTNAGGTICQLLGDADTPQLKHIRLQRLGITDDDVETLLGGSFPALEHLGLNDNRFGDRAVEAIAKADLPGLRELFLGSNALGKGAIDALAGASAPALRKLGLDYLTNELFSLDLHIDQLIDSTSLPKGLEIWVDGTSVEQVYDATIVRVGTPID